MQTTRKMSSWLTKIIVGLFLVVGAQAQETEDFLDQDIGAVGLSGSAAFSGETVTLRGSGIGSDTSRDAYHFLHQALSGDGELIIKATSINGGSAQSALGITIRETQQPSARSIALFKSAAGNISFSQRSVATTAAVNVSTISKYGPTWLKLQRKGSSFSAYTSTDGVVWAKLGSDVILSMPYTVYAGAAIFSGNTTTTATGIVDHLSIKGVADGNGLFATYFNDKNLVANVFSRVDGTVNFQWGTGSPDSRINADNFSIRWVGQIQPKYSELYNLSTASDEGVKLWINNRQLINDWSGHTTTTRSGSIFLEAGKKYDIILEYFEGSGPAQVGLYWSSRSQPFELVPSKSLFTNAKFGGLKAEYYDALDFKALRLMRVDPMINFNWQSASPATQIGLKKYSVRWTGFIESKVTENHTFYVKSSDGCRLLIDGAKVIDDWGLHALRESQGTILLQAGRKYSVVLEYFEDTGSSILQLQWSSPSQPKDIISPKQFSAFANSSDTTKPSIPTALKVEQKNDVSATLSWTDSTDDTGILGYMVYRDGALVERVASPKFYDKNRTAGTTYRYTVRSIDAFEQVSDLSAALAVTMDKTAVPSPWKHQEVGSVWIGGSAVFNAATSGFAITAAGNDYDINKDAFHYVYQPLSGNGIIIARVNSLSQETANATVGLMVRCDMTENSQYAMTTIGAGGTSAWFERRDRIYGQIQANQPQTVSGPQWIKLVRQGNYFTSYRSQDGNNWVFCGAVTIDLPASVFIGVATASYAPDISVSAAVDQVTIYDGKDTDGDGVSDFDEVLITGTDPKKVDLQAGSVVQQQTGAQAFGVIGNWQLDGTAYYALDRNGSLEYAFNTNSSDAWILEVLGASHGSNLTTTQAFDIAVYIDDQYVQNLNLISVKGANGLARCLTPYLSAGLHRIRLTWNNTSGYISLAIKQVQLKAILNPNLNAIEKLDQLNTVDVAPITSTVSPVCLEGKARDIGTMSVYGGVTVNNAPDSGWFANVPLLPKEPTIIPITFENNKLSTVKTIQWLPVNLLTSGDLTIRRGDSLQLTGYPTVADKTEVKLVLTNGYSYTTTADAPVTQVFNTAGTVKVTVTYKGSPPKTVTVTVLDANFGTVPDVWIGRARDWSCPSVPTSAKVQWDSRLVVTERLSGTTRIFNLTIDQPASRYVLARLPGGGPIIASSEIRGFNLSSSKDTDVRIIQTLPDGNRIVEMSVVLNRAVTDITVQLNIAVSGVTFDDGTVVKKLTAADFDELGVAKVRFIYPAGTKTSVCHTLSIYQGSTLVGKR